MKRWLLDVTRKQYVASGQQQPHGGCIVLNEHNTVFASIVGLQGSGDRRKERCLQVNKNSSGDEIANVNFLTTISHTRRPTSKYRKGDKPISFNKLDDR